MRQDSGKRVASTLQPKIFLAGSVAVEIHGVVVQEAEFHGRQNRLVFAYLVAEQGRPVPRDELAEALWGEATPATWDKALTGIVSKLRSLLADAGIDSADVLTGAFGCYRLELPEGSWVDVIVAANEAKAADEALAENDLEKAKIAAGLAASLLQQPFLPGEEGSWVEAKRRDFADIRGRALSALADAHLRLGNPSEAAKWAEQTVALAPFRETGYRRLMEAHAAAGNRAEALRVYERCRRLLAEELGAYPSPEIESIYRDLLEVPAPSTPAVVALEAPSPDALPFGERASEAPSAWARPPPVRVRKRRRLLMLVPLMIAAVAAATVTVVLITREDPSSAARGVSADSIGVLSSSGKLIALAAVRTGPSAIAVGEGAIWSANVDDDSVSEIDSNTNASVQTVRVGKGPNGVAVGGGFVWVTNGLAGTVSKIDPRTRQVVETIPVGNGPSGVAFGERAVWVANATDRTVTRIDPGTGRKRVLPAGAGADGIAVGNGAVWVTSESAGTLTRIDPRAGIVTPSINVGRGASAVAVGLGVVWVANSLDGTVSRVDPASNSVRRAIEVGAGPRGLAVTGNGKTVWVASELAGAIWRIQGDSARRILTTGNRPVAVATSGGTIYVAVRTSGLAHRGGVLRVLAASPFDSIDPAFAYSAEAWQALTLTNDGLVTFKREGGSEGTRLVSDLAVEIPTPSDEGRTFTFRVRRGVRYSNGEPVRPEDIRRGIERSVVAYARSGEGSGYSYSSIVGYDACLKHPRSCDLSKGIVADKAMHMVTFHLVGADEDFLFKLALPSADAMPAGTPLRARLPLPATGPYMFVGPGSKRGARLVRNPRFHEWYRAAQLDGYPREIRWRFNIAPSKQRLLVERGNADVALDAGISDEGPNKFPPAALFAKLQAHHASQLHLNPILQTFYVFLNTRVPPFNDVRVRRALNYAVDRNRMGDLRGGPALEQPSCQVLPPSMDGYQRFCPYTIRPSADGQYRGPDLATARQLVAASGTQGEKVTVVGIVGIFQPHGGDYLVSVLRALGYKVRFKNLKRGAYFARIADSRNGIQAGISGWLQDYPSAGSFFNDLLTCRSFTPGSSANMNYSAFCNRRIDAEITHARSLQITDPGAASRLWTKVDHEVVREAPWLVIQNPLSLVLVSRRVGNYQYNPQWGALLGQLWVR
jgi:YVTN family beta-propeller protein